MATPNPYASPVNTTETLSQTVAACPNCNHRIAFRQIAFAPFPLFLSCEQCNAKLIGGAFVRIQAVTITTAPLIVAAISLLLSWPTSNQDCLLVGIGTLLFAFVFALVNVPATVYWGGYKLRDFVPHTQNGG